MKPDVATIGILGVIGYLLSTKGASAAPGSTAGGVHLPGATPATPPKPSGGSSGGSSGGGSGGGAPSGGSGGGSVSKNPPQVYVCADGSLVTDPSLCPSMPGNGGECADSTYVDDISTCPENQPQIYDSGDPCDPNSAAYDPSQCGSPTTPNTWDSMDPCDPTSDYYEPSECYDTSGYTPSDASGDSFNPCDPTSVAYDEYACGLIEGVYDNEYAFGY